MTLFLYRVSSWTRNLLSVKFITSLLGSFGVLWLCVEITAFFSEPAARSIKSYWYLFVFSGLIYAAVTCKPQLKFSCRLTNRDAIIEVAIGNIFDFPGALVIGSNTTFDTEISDDLISKFSIQGQFTERYYRSSRQLDLEIQNGVKNLSHEELEDDRVGKKKKYDIGSIVKVMPQGKIAYLMAIAHMNQHGTAYGEFEFIKESLPKLWAFIGERGSKGPVVMPVLGTGFARIHIQREEVVREIVRSFVAACAEKVFCEKLTIVVSPNDARAYSIDLKKIGDFVTHVCQYTEYAPSRPVQRGQGIT